MRRRIRAATAAAAPRCFRRIGSLPLFRRADLPPLCRLRRAKRLCLSSLLLREALPLRPAAPPRQPLPPRLFRLRLLLWKSRRYRSSMRRLCFPLSRTAWSRQTEEKTRRPPLTQPRLLRGKPSPRRMSSRCRRRSPPRRHRSLTAPPRRRWRNPPPFRTPGRKQPLRLPLASFCWLPQVLRPAWSPEWRLREPVPSRAVPDNKSVCVQNPQVLAWGFIYAGGAARNR